MLGLSYWVFPVVASLVWLSTLLGLLLHWIIDTDRTIYPTMRLRGNQSIAYISDTGAFELKPLFIAGCVITTVFLDLGFLSDRWLRHHGRLVPNTTRGEKILSGLTIVFAIVGTVGLILLSIFDTNRHHRLHDVFLILFIVGYVISAIFICWEYQRLGIHNREHRILAISFWIKLAFIVVVVILAIAFGVTDIREMYDTAAIFEWTIAFYFSLYIVSFTVDLYPAVRTKHKRGHFNYRTKSWEAANQEHKMEQGLNNGHARNGSSVNGGTSGYL